MNPTEFYQKLTNMHYHLTDDVKKQFADYFETLVEVNQYLNLTRITEEDEVYLKHFYDSLTPLFAYPELFESKVSLCDVGAGAGFPSIPMKILHPEIEVTIVDSLQKRLNFLDDLTKKLGITGVHLVHGRAEEVGQNEQYREKFDLVTARAVARMSVLSEYCLPLVKLDGKFLALKGPKAEQEIQEAGKAIKTLGGKVIDQKQFNLPDTDEERNLILISKTEKCPKKYPRQAGTPARKPL
ncbi:MAG: 16S rRNA (guanine(527)-N(7))-methyltransferase RsmG [Lactobacillus sp.]|nr:16S rRNA (guanine(527)-N(7))-methyltransferase RsmG [Lactobacillus sp.]